MNQPIRTLLFSTLYPSSARPLHGIFVETRLRELLRTGEVETKVLAPVPWFPSTADRFGDYARMAATPARELHNGVEVLHPRYLVIPKIGMSMAPVLLAAATIGPVRRLIEGGFDFDVIDAHYFYPDGVAAVMLARMFGKPVTITARGTDLNLIPRYVLPRGMMKWAARHADASIGVCQALVNVLRSWNIAADSLHEMRNGVDLHRFRPLPQVDARSNLGIEGRPVLLSVGNLLELKGHHLVIDALPNLRAIYPGIRLAIVGHGPERERLAQRAHERGVFDEVIFAGAVPNEQMPWWFSAADVLVLASSREGWSNVLLEAMACGTPVAATRVGGAQEVLSDAAGVIFEQRTADAIVTAVRRLLDVAPSRAKVRQHAEGFGWEETSRLQLELFRQLRGATPKNSYA